MLTSIPAIPLDIPVGPAEIPNHIRTALTVLGVPITVLVENFALDGDVLDAEGTLSPEQGAKCLLRIAPDTWDGTKPSELVEEHETYLRFCIEASVDFCVLPILDIIFLEARLTADGQWEWFLSCGGEGVCDFCDDESPKKCA